ncbi:hypothetical protein Pla52n_46880 [Stieleria varia]|uniref:Uncharacterized protein n=1 Tax=Stieleria varia TaxID=2528005 RepID=A0A5C6AT44_9BACT|nr:hypothetical protein Pla52n_46880 [Stieleria varia]
MQIAFHNPTRKRGIYRVFLAYASVYESSGLTRMIHQPARDSVRFPITGVRTGRYRVAADMRRLFSCQSAQVVSCNRIAMTVLSRVNNLG